MYFLDKRRRGGGRGGGGKTGKGNEPEKRDYSMEPGEGKGIKNSHS